MDARPARGFVLYSLADSRMMGRESKGRPWREKFSKILKRLSFIGDEVLDPESSRSRFSVLGLANNLPAAT
jgi:hypothetical protein